MSAASFSIRNPVSAITMHSPATLRLPDAGTAGTPAAKVVHRNPAKAMEEVFFALMGSSFLLMAGTFVAEIIR